MKICATSFLALFEILFSGNKEKRSQKKPFDMVSFLIKRNDVLLRVFFWLMVGVSLLYLFGPSEVQFYSKLSLFNWNASIVWVTGTLIFSYLEWSIKSSESSMASGYSILNFGIAGLYMYDIFFYPSSPTSIFHIIIALMFLGLGFGFLLRDAQEM